MLHRKISPATVIGLVLVCFGICLALPFGHGAVMSVRNAMVHHEFRQPDFWRHILIALGLFIAGAGGIIAIRPIKGKTLSISERSLFASAYLYMIIPTVIFFFGWLKLPLALLFSAILAFGVYWYLKHTYTQKNLFALPVQTVVLVVCFVAVWIYTTGIGGFWNQTYDMHWRNAALRDLSTYSWPVIFPETGNALVYYFNFWMVPALFGKLFGFTGANVVFYVWSVIGVSLAAFLLLRYLNARKLYEALAVVLVLASFGGLDILGAYFNEGGLYKVPFGWPDFFSGVQNTPNNQLLEWVHNQSIVPWLGAALFLNEQRIASLALLGLCVLPFAPIPFVGFFVILVLWATVQGVLMLRRHEGKKLIRDIFSVPNVCAVLSIFIVFAFFFSTNVAANGSDGSGGLGVMWWVRQHNSMRFVLYFVIFYVLDVYAFCFLVFKRNRKNPFFYIVAIPIFFYPHIRLGTGRDFGLRAWIPAMFFIMVFVLQELLNKDRRITVRKTLLIVFLTFSSFNLIGSNLVALASFAKTKVYPQISDENVKTFSDKIGTMNENFVLERPQDTAFFRYLSKAKSKKAHAKDMQRYTDYLYSRGLSFASGYYTISPLLDASLCLAVSDEELPIGGGVGKKILLASGNVPVYVDVAALRFGDYVPEHNAYRICDTVTAWRLDVPFHRVDEEGTVWAMYPNPADAQKWNIMPVSGGYKLIWHGYALAYSKEGGVHLELASDSEKQIWHIQKDAQKNTHYAGRKDEPLSYTGYEYMLARSFVLPQYLKELEANKARYTTFLAVRDESTVSVTDEVIVQLHALGLQQSLKGKVQHGYIAVIDRGTVVYESIAESPNNQVVTSGKLDNGLRYHIESAGLPAGDFCSIIINGHQQAVNYRGVNFVVYDNELGKVVDSVAFDTWAQGMPCYR